MLIQAVPNTDWEFLFRGDDANKKVDILNERLKSNSIALFPTE